MRPVGMANDTACIRLGRPWRLGTAARTLLVLSASLSTSE
ncbi:hypothetical protein RKD22_001126 [Streptomyces pristinaespiralis]